METVYDIRKIMSLLPHRYPFLLIDRVLELMPGERISAFKNVTINEPFFQGHYPGMPIMPGVLIVEAMAQAGGLLAFSSLSEEMHGKPIYFMGIDKVRFRMPVVPGDRIVFEVKMLKQRARAMKMAGVATVEGKRVSEAELMATIGEDK